VVLLGIWEHHANILPWQILAEEYGFTIEFINLFPHPNPSPAERGSIGDYDIDWEDFEKKYDEKVKIVAVSHVSNVTGKIYDVKKIGEKLREETFFLIDGSQSVPNFPVNVGQIDCDCLVFTAHKMMAYTGIGVVYLKKEYIKNLTPMIAGGGTVEDVTTHSYTLRSDGDKFEAGTPNIIGAVSLLKAIEYITSIGGIEKIWEHEMTLVQYFIKKLQIADCKLQIV
jgi:cysteine desulfurase/selenocysteine lyase